MWCRGVTPPVDVDTQHTPSPTPSSERKERHVPPRKTGSISGSTSSY